MKNLLSSIIGISNNENISYFVSQIMLEIWFNLSVFSCMKNRIHL